MSSNTVLIICFTDLSRDARVQRQLVFLQQDWKIITLGASSPNTPNVEFLSCGRIQKSYFEKISFGIKALTKNFESYYWNLPYIQDSAKQLEKRKFDLIIANDILTLPLALRFANGAKVVFDAHEYAPKENEHIWHWRLFHQGLNEYLCKNYMPKADQTITVSQGLADEYSKEMGVQSQIIMNAPRFHLLEPKKPNPQKIRMIHHGQATPSRKIELLISLFDYLDERFELDLMLVPFSLSYIRKLKNMAKKHPNIRFLPQVPLHDIVSFLHPYDIGVYLLEPSSFNEKYALPGKLFEFIQARLMVGVGPSIEMARIVNQYQCGVVAENFHPMTLAQTLIKLDAEKILQYKRGSHRAAQELSAEKNQQIFLNVVQRAIKGASC